MIDLVTGIPAAVSEGISVTALLLGLGTIAIIELFPLVTKKVPATLVALIVMTVVSLFCNLDSKLIIGDIPSGLPLPFFANANISLSGIDWMTVLKASLIPGLTLAGLGSSATPLPVFSAACLAQVPPCAPWSTSRAADAHKSAVWYTPCFCSPSCSD